MGRASLRSKWICVDGSEWIGCAIQAASRSTMSSYDLRPARHVESLLRISSNTHLTTAAQVRPRSFSRNTASIRKTFRTCHSPPPSADDDPCACSAGKLGTELPVKYISLSKQGYKVPNAVCFGGGGGGNRHLEMLPQTPCSPCCLAPRLERYTPMERTFSTWLAMTKSDAGFSLSHQRDHSLSLVDHGSAAFTCKWGRSPAQ